MLGRDDDNLAGLLEKALQLARRFPGNAGMASVELAYNPYECVWYAHASWSDGTRMPGLEDGETPSEAVQKLIEMLKEE